MYEQERSNHAWPSHPYLHANTGISASRVIKERDGAGLAAQGRLCDHIGASQIAVVEISQQGQHRHTDDHHDKQQPDHDARLRSSRDRAVSGSGSSSLGATQTSTRSPKRRQLHLVGVAVGDRTEAQQGTEGVAAQLGPVGQPTPRGAVEQRGELRVTDRWRARGPECGEMVVAIARRATTAIDRRHANDAAHLADAPI